jgi:hypothetical protein
LEVLDIGRREAGAWAAWSGLPAAEDSSIGRNRNKKTAIANQNMLFISLTFFSVG